MTLLSTLATTLILATASGAAAPPSIQIQDFADAFVEADKAPGIAIGVLDESGRIKTYCAGTLTAGGTRPITENTIFETGSVSKTFAAVLAHMLEQQGELSLSDPVNIHLPDGVQVPAFNGNEITLWHLATHTSGLPRVPARLDSGDSYYPFTVEELYEFLPNWKPDRAPGESYSYSNLGYGLLGLVLELNQETSFEELAKQHILRRLKMRNTGCSFDETFSERLATPHHGTTPTTIRPWTQPTAGAGGIKSTARDLMLFAKANLSDSRTPLHRSLRACQVPRVSKKTRANRVGLGWHVSGESSEPVIGHSGATNGFRTYLGFMPGRNRAVVVLANSNSSVDHLGQYLLTPASTTPPDYLPSPDVDISEYAGRYQHDDGSVFVVGILDGQMTVRLNDQRPATFIPIDEDLFLNRTVDARLQFERDARGRVRTLVLKQAGSVNTFRRKP